MYAATERECWRKLREKIAEIEGGALTSRERERMTVNELFDLWLETKSGKAFRTRDSYESVTRLHLKPTLGHLRVRDVRRSDVEKAIVVWSNGPRLDGKRGRRGNTAVRQCITYLSGAFKLAKDDGIRKDNPVDGVRRPPRVKSKKHFVLAPGAIEILQAAKATPYHTPLFNAFVLGLRPAELLALRRRDVDLEAGHVVVASALESRGKKYLARKLPKSESGNREIPIGELNASVLRQHLIDQERRLNAKGTVVTPDTPLFDDGNGQIWHPDDFRNGFRLIRKKANLEKFPWRATRHSFASMGVTVDVHTKVIAEILGHEDDKLASGIYEQVHRDSKLNANRKIAEQLSAVAPPIA